jgi:hypothetical protein
MFTKNRLTAGSHYRVIGRKAQLRRLFYCLESSGESVANPIVDRQQLLTGEGHRSDAHDRDQRGNQAIFDGGDAGFVLEKTSDNGIHAQFLSQSNGCAARRSALSRQGIIDPRCLPPKERMKIFTAFYTLSISGYFLLSLYCALERMLPAASPGGLVSQVILFFGQCEQPTSVACIRTRSYEFDWSVARPIRSIHRICSQC